MRKGENLTVFESQLEQLIVTEELLFDSTAGFGRYKPFLEQSIAHPAKMNTRLLEFLVKAHTKEGDVVLDPMAGSGSTGVISALHGRNGINVELEEKFYGWMEEAKRKVEAYNTLSRKGNIANVKGDARQLSKLLEQADVVLTSPPYSCSDAGGKTGERNIRAKILRGEKPNPHFGGIRSLYSGISENPENIGNLKHGEVDTVITSPPYVNGTKGPSRSPLWERLSKDPTSNRYGRKTHPTIGEGYGKSKNNIGNLPIDAVITSPPYAETQSFQDVEFMKKIQQNQNEKLRKGEIKGHSKTEVAAIREFEKIEKGKIENIDNIGNLGFVDSVITSPPYGEVIPFHDKEFLHKLAMDIECGKTKGHSHGKEGHERELDADYGENPNNIGNLPIDTIITSPPYETSASDSSKSPCITKPPRTGDIRQSFRKAPINRYSKSPKQIGNLQKETYLEAMLKVYSEMWKVLKPEGAAIIVIKPFIRNKKVVDLPWHTWLLLEKVGFKLAKVYKLRLKQDSFWRALYKKKYPDVPEIKHEYIIVCQKSPSFYG